MQTLTQVYSVHCRARLAAPPPGSRSCRPDLVHTCSLPQHSAAPACTQYRLPVTGPDGRTYHNPHWSVSLSYADVFGQWLLSSTLTLETQMLLSE